MFRGQDLSTGRPHLKRWRYLATRDVPDIDNARALWEHDEWDPDAKAWRETVKTIEWETNQAAKGAQAIDGWHRSHSLQSVAIRMGLKKPPADLERLEQTYGENCAFLEGSQQRLQEIEQGGPQKRLVYQRKLEREGEEILKAKRYVGG